MKRLALALLIFSAAYVHAEDRNKTFPFADSFTMEAPRISSCTNANTSAGGALIVSTNPAVLFNVEITSAGANSSVSFFDSVNASTTSFRRQYGPINGDTELIYPGKSVYFGSTMTISNFGSPAANVCFEYMPFNIK